MINIPEKPKMIEIPKETAEYVLSVLSDRAENMSHFGDWTIHQRWEIEYHTHEMELALM